VCVLIAILSVLALPFFVLCELVTPFLVPWWLYFLAAGAFAAGVIRRGPLRVQRARVCLVAAVVAIIIALYFVPWTSRKPFLRDLARVNPGMTESEVRRIMARYMEGSGWPALPGGDTSNAPGTLSIVGSKSTFSTETSPSGKIAIQNALIFRHSNKGEFNSDWGIVSFSNGIVVSVEFSPD
jgi:hypothetical protein